VKSSSETRSETTAPVDGSAPSSPILEAVPEDGNHHSVTAHVPAAHTHPGRHHLDRHFSARYDRVLRNRTVRKRLESGPARIRALDICRTASRVPRRAPADTCVREASAVLDPWPTDSEAIGQHQRDRRRSPPARRIVRLNASWHSTTQMAVELLRLCK
jgi:hypothetical protein